MSVPNVNCKIYYYENEETLSWNAEKQKKYGERRKFYSANNSFDYLTYVNTGSQKKLDYVEYSGDREKSTGVFNADGLLSVGERRELRRKLRKTQSVIWDCILTFQHEFGQRYCNEFEQAYDLMRKEFPRFLKSAGLRPDNVTWYAALHVNKAHRHIHVSFYENNPTRIMAHKKELQFSKGKIPLACINQFKIRAELALTDVCSELKIMRKEVTDLTRNVLFSDENKRKYDALFREKIIRLIEMLPSEGRLSYDSENMKPLRPVIRKIVDYTIKSRAPLCTAFTNFCCIVNKRDGEICEILIRNHIAEKDWQHYLKADTYLEDIYRRLGNQIINYARVYKRKESKAKGRLCKKRVRQKAVENLLFKAAKIQTELENDALYLFQEFLRKLEEAHEENADYGESRKDEME